MKKTLTGLTLAAAFAFTALAASPAAAAPPYQNCDAAAAEGVYNIPAGDPRYAPGLDRDKDNVACDDPNQPPATPMPNPPADPGGNQMDRTPKGGANTGVTPEEGTDATGVLLGAGGIIAVGHRGRYAPQVPEQRVISVGTSRICGTTRRWPPEPDGSGGCRRGFSPRRRQ